MCGIVPGEIHDDPRTLRFNGGWEDLFLSHFNVRFSIISSPWASFTTSFSSVADADVMLGAQAHDLQATLLDWVGRSANPPSLFIRSDLWNPSELDLQVLDEFLFSEAPLRLVVALKRTVSPGWSRWIAKWGQFARAECFCSMPRLKMRRFGRTKEAWVWDEGIWEFFLLESGSKPVGLGLDWDQIGSALSSLTHRARGSWASPSQPGPLGEQHDPTVNRSAEYTAFWEKWDRLAQHRAELLNRHHVPWAEVAQSLREANILLSSSPDRKLRRIARLASLPSDHDLTVADCLIYAVCGPHLTYIGQVGAINGIRPPIERFKEHIQKGKSIRNHYAHKSGRNTPARVKLRARPTIGRIFARVGPHTSTMLPIERVIPERAGERERFWARVHAPTVNAVTPFGGIDRILWEEIVSKSCETPEGKSLKAKALWLLDHPSALDCASLLLFLVKVDKHVESSIFERLFRLAKSSAKKEWDISLKRRFVIRVPSYDESVLRLVKEFCEKHFRKFAVPEPLIGWMVHALSVIPFSTPSVASAIHGSGSTSVPFLTSQALGAVNDSQQCASWSPIDSSFGAWVLDRDFDPDTLVSVQQTVAAWVEKQACKCQHLRAEFPALRNATGHLVLRSDEQWACLFEPLAAEFMSSNARNRTFPDAAFVHSRFEDFAKCLSDLQVPVLQSATGSFTSQSVLVEKQISVFTSEVSALTWNAIESESRGATWLTADAIAAARDTIWDLRLRTGQWDKQLHRNFGICRHLDDAKWLKNIIFGSRFSIWGWAHSVTEAKIVAMQHILHKALDKGIIDDAKSLRKIPKHLHTVSDMQQWFLQLLGSEDLPDIPEIAVVEDTGVAVGDACESNLYPDTTQPQTPSVPPLFTPSIFSILKWKTDELTTAALRFRDIVSFKGHPLQSYSRVMSRCLQLLVNALIEQSEGFGFACMPGVRDQLVAACRLGAIPEHTHLVEKDMADMFWEIPLEQVVLSLEWALASLAKKRRSTSLTFAVSKADKHLDHIGSAASNAFLNVTQDLVTRFVRFDTYDNVLFVAGPVILRQGLRGVPIGGFISAQLAEIWAIWREVTALHGEQVPQTIQDIHSAIRQPPRDFVDSPKPADLPLEVRCTFSDNSDFTMAPRNAACMIPSGKIMTAPSCPAMTIDSLREVGCYQWWAPLDSMFGSVQVGSETVWLIKSTPWDGAANGRISTVLQHVHKKQRGRVANFLKAFHPLLAVRGEILNPMCWPDSQQLSAASFPFVLFSRYRDNIYLICANMGARLLEHIKFVVSVILRIVYGIPLKWEAHGSDVVWGEAVITHGSHPSVLRLRRKGVCLDLRDTVNAEWHKWVHPKAPNARVVWRSLVSALICKSMWYAWSRDDLVCNVRSIIWGLTIRGYPSRWWKGRVFRACQRFALDAFFTKTDILVWIEEAKRFVCDSESAGPSSGSVL